MGTSYFKRGILDLVFAKEEKVLTGLKEVDIERTFTAELEVVEIARVSMPAGAALILCVDMLEEMLLNGGLPADTLRTRLDSLFDRVEQELEANVTETENVA